MWPRLASLVADRFALAWIAGAGVWLGYFVSLALGGGRFDAAGHPLGADHVQYFVVGRLVDEGTPRLIYDEATMTRRQKEIGGDAWKGYLPFRYPPFYAPAFVPTSRLGYLGSFLAWTLVGLGCLLLAGRLLGVAWRDWLSWSFCFYPVFAAFSFGQNGLVTLCVLAGAQALWLRGRPTSAGLVLGLLAFKPHLALGVGLMWVFDARRDWRALAGVAATTAALALAGYLAIPSAYEAFFDSARGNVSMHEQGRAGLAPLYGSQGFWQLLLSARFDRLALPLEAVTSVAGLAVFYLAWRRWRQRPAAAFALAVLATPWLTPYSMAYDWTILLVPAVLLKGELPSERWLGLCGVLWVAVLLSFPFVRGQLWLAERLALPEVALQAALPALVFAVLVLWRTPRCDDFLARPVPPSP